MTPDEIADCIREMDQGRATAKATIAKLVAGGVGYAEAREDVFISLGGGDIQTYDENGKAWFRRSGKSVEEIKRLMEE